MQPRHSFPSGFRQVPLCVPLKRFNKWAFLGIHVDEMIFRRYRDHDVDRVVIVVRAFILVVQNGILEAFLVAQFEPLLVRLGQ